MPLRGENIGTAYVRILADGKDFGRSVKKALDDEEVFDAFDESARKTSESWRSTFAEEQKKAPNQQALRDAIAGPLARGNWLNETFFNSRNWNNFRSGMDKEYGDAGERAVENFEAGLLRGDLDFDALIRQLENVLPAVLKAEQEIRREAQDDRLTQEKLGAELSLEIEEDLLKERLDLDRDFEEEAARLHEEAVKARLDLDREFTAEHKRLAQEASDAYDAQMQAQADADREFEIRHRINQREHIEGITKLTDAYDELIVSVDRLGKGLTIERSRHQLIKDLEAIHKQMDLVGLSTFETDNEFRDHYRTLRLMHPQLDKVSRALDTTADSFGRAFGKGSRNDFLNIIGSISGGMVRLLGIVPATGRVISDFFIRASVARRESGIFAGLGSMVTDLGKVAAGLGGAVVGAFGFVGPMVAALSQLLGFVVALASSIGYALVGALGALPAVALPAVAGIGALALAFYDLDKAEKQMLKNDIEPVIDAFGELADAARIGIFDRLGNQADRFAGIIDSLQPMFRRLGFAISDVAKNWLNMTDSPAFDEWVDTMGSFLPTAVRRLGRITGSTLGGFGGLFRAMIPFMSDVLEYLVDITDTFSDWANSAAGQNEIEAFFDDAKESVIDFGDFLRAARDLLFEVIESGKHTGDSMFAGMADQFDEWTAALEKNPEILNDWFEAAEDFAGVLGDLLINLGKVASALDNEFTRSFSATIFEGFAFALETIATLLETVADLLGIGEDSMLGFAGQVAAAAFILPKLNSALGGTSLALGGFVGKGSTAISKMAAMQSAARGLAGVGGLLAITGASQTSNDAVGVLLSTLGGAATGFAIGGPIGALIGGGLGGLLGLANAADKAGDAAEDMDEKWSGLAATLDETTGAITEMTEAHIRDTLASEGILGLLEQEGINRRTVIDAMLGQKGAQRELDGVMAGEQTQLDNLNAKLERLAQKRIDLAAIASPDSPNYDPDADERLETLDETIELTEEQAAAQQHLIDVIGGGTATLEHDQELARQRARDLQDFTALAKLVPEKVFTKIDAKGVTPTLRGVAKVAEKYDLLDKRELEALIEAVIPGTTVKELRDFMKQLDDIDKKHPQPRVGADTREAREKAREATQWLTEFARSTFVSTVDVDNDPARAGITETEQWLNNLPDEMVQIHVERVYGGGAGPQPTAQGGIFTGRQTRTIGEAGPEAVVPLDRALSQVDPAVRFLSAIAQGLATPSAGASKIVDVGGIQVFAPSADPEAVAVATVNRLVAVTY